MIHRIILFAILGAISGAFIGWFSAEIFMNTNGSVANRAMLANESMFFWGGVGVVHGIVLFASSIGESPTIENTRSGAFVVSSLASRFDCRHFGHRIAYITLVFGLIIAVGVAPLLAQETSLELKSLTTRLLVGIGISFVWTVISMILNIVIVSKLALRGT